MPSRFAKNAAFRFVDARKNAVGLLVDERNGGEPAIRIFGGSELRRRTMVTGGVDSIGQEMTGRGIFGTCHDFRTLMRVPVTIPLSLSL